MGFSGLACYHVFVHSLLQTVETDIRPLPPPWQTPSPKSDWAKSATLYPAQLFSLASNKFLCVRIWKPMDTSNGLDFRPALTC